MIRIDTIGSFYQQLQIQIQKRIEKQSHQAALYYLQEVKTMVEQEIANLEHDIKSHTPHKKTKKAIQRTYEGKQETVTVNSMEDLFELLSDKG